MSMCVCVCVCIYIYVCVCVYIYMCVCVCIYIYVCVYIYICVCVCVCIYMYVCVCVCVCVCVYILHWNHYKYSLLYKSILIHEKLKCMCIIYLTFFKAFEENIYSNIIFSLLLQVSTHLWKMQHHVTHVHKARTASKCLFSYATITEDSNTH